MIHLTADTRILLSSEPADFRKGIDGFIALCQHTLSENPSSGELFVFLNRQRTQLRVLHYDGSGYWLHSKRLSKGRFPPYQTTQTLIPLLAHELSEFTKGRHGFMPCSKKAA